MSRNIVKYIFFHFIVVILHPIKYLCFQYRIKEIRVNFIILKHFRITFLNIDHVEDTKNIILELQHRKKKYIIIYDIMKKPII